MFGLFWDMLLKVVGKIRHFGMRIEHEIFNKTELVIFTASLTPPSWA